MRKLIIGTLLLLLPIICFGQLVKTSMTYAQPVAEAGFTPRSDHYAAILAAMTTDPTGDTLTWQDDLIFSLDSAAVGFWDRIDILYITAQRNTQGANLNWINPAAFTLTDPGATTPAFVPYQGYTGDGSTDYLLTNYSLLTDAINVGQDDFTVGIYNRAQVSSSGYVFGVSDATNYITARVLAATLRYYLSQGTAEDESGYFENADGFHLLRRSAAEVTESYYNGTTSGDGVVASGTRPVYDITLLARNTVTTPDSFGTWQISVFLIMDAITDAEAAILSTIINKYMTRIGTNVY